MAGECELGVTGLATMGQNLARNAARQGFPVAVHNRTATRTRDLLERHGHEGELHGAFSVEELAAALARWPSGASGSSAPACPAARRAPCTAPASCQGAALRRTTWSSTC